MPFVVLFWRITRFARSGNVGEADVDELSQVTHARKRNALLVLGLSVDLCLAFVGVTSRRDCMRAFHCMRALQFSCLRLLVPAARTGRHEQTKRNEVTAHVRTGDKPTRTRTGVRGAHWSLRRSRQRAWHKLGRDRSGDVHFVAIPGVDLPACGRSHNRQRGRNNRQTGNELRHTSSPLLYRALMISCATQERTGNRTKKTTTRT
jgi:hypothetical protein